MPQKLKVEQARRRVVTRTVVKAEKSVARIRRVRPAKETKQAPQCKILASDQKRMVSLLQSIAKSQQQLEELNTYMQSMNRELFSLMKTYRLPVFETAEAVASVAYPRGRATSVIDVAKFRDLVDDEDFMASVKVMAEKAKAVVPGKELEAITETTPGKKGDAFLEVKRKA